MNQYVTSGTLVERVLHVCLQRDHQQVMSVNARLGDQVSQELSFKVGYYYELISKGSFIRLTIVCKLFA